MPNNNDSIKIYEPLKCSNIQISLDNVIENIKNSIYVTLMNQP